MFSKESSKLSNLPPRIRHFATYPWKGGAGIAAGRLVEALNLVGSDVQLWGTRDEVIGSSVAHGVPLTRGIRQTIFRRLTLALLKLERKQFLRAKDGVSFFSDRSCFAFDLVQELDAADLVHFHWMCDFLDYSYNLPRMPARIPVVWTMHDLAAATGGCYHPINCTRFQQRCGSCPQLTSSNERDCTRKSWERKQSAVRRMKAQLRIVAPSHWIAGELAKSSLFCDTPCTVIRNPLNLEVFRPVNSSEARKRLGLPLNVPLVLLAAASIDNPLKGMQSFVEAASLLRRWNPAVHFAALGELTQPFPDELGIIHLCSTNDVEELVRFYSAGDMLVIPSRIENFPNVVAEAFACGTPAVGFPVGGIPELIRDGDTGFLAADLSALALSSATARLLSTLPVGAFGWKQRCRAYAEQELDSVKVARQHLDLYASLLVAGS
jgi:glycosyltransferase involved in cell wall biosynthesis